MRHYGLFVELFSILLLIAGCGGEYKPTAAEFFRDTMNLDPLPPGISDFRKANREEPPYTAGKGYFTYQATPPFIAALLKHDKFFKGSKDDPSNQKIREVPCDEIYYGASVWAEELHRISTRNKVCFTGIFLPYAHILIYDPATQTVDHFFYPIAP